MISNAREILEHSDIRDVLDQLGIQIDRNDRCPCPVHGGSDHNFSVRDGIGHCFSQCGKTWDAAELLMDLNGWTFPEAVEYLARIYQIDIKYSGNRDRASEIHHAKQKQERREKLWHLNAAVAEIFRAGLGRSARIGKRKYNRETLDAFQVGKVSGSKSLTDLAGKSVKALVGQKLDAPLLQELALIRPSKHGDGFYDFFRDRYIFPIHDRRGNIAGFSGRKFEDDTDPKNPKYLNSKESLVYNKSQLLYGLWQGRQAIRRKQFAYLVEGNTDVLSLYDQGIENVVAPCGTALTDDQARILKRYCDVAILLFDGDEAGEEASDRSISTLLAAGFTVRVVLLPDGQDPDSYIRKLGVDEFREWNDEHSQDALIWKVTKDYVKDDIHKRETALRTAATLISLVRSDIQRSMYINDLVKTLGRESKKVLQDKIKDIEEDRLRQSKSPLTLRQQQDIINFGIYEKNNRYYESHIPDHQGTPVSNFVIKPIMLIVGTDRSRRLVEVINEYGHSFIKDIDSDDFVELSSLKKQVERRGNFIFNGKSETYTRIKSKVYTDMPVAYPVFTLGYHKSGFYAWGNGITVDGEFIPVDEYGLVEYNGTKYFLPAFSKIHADIKSDDQENTYEEEKKFVYVRRDDCPDVRTWAKDFGELYGAKGHISIAFYFASLFRDLIFSRLGFFPHLNFFGPSGYGKSFMAHSLAAMFGKPRAPFHLMHGTNVGFFRKLAQSRNAIAWLDEYKNEIDFRRLEALKAAYDGSGYEKGVKSTDNRTVRTKVNCASIIAGQHQPVKDIALFKRCISLNFSTGTFTDRQRELIKRMRPIEKSGALSAITSELTKHRTYIDEHFDEALSSVSRYARVKLKGQDIEDRIFHNHCLVGAIYAILDDIYKLETDTAAVSELLVENIDAQSKAMMHEDELSVWWKAVEYLLGDDQIRHNEDLIVEITEQLRVTNSDKSTRTLVLDSPRPVLYLRFTRIHPKYMEMHRRQTNSIGLSLGTLQHYLRTSKAFIGYTRAKKFDGQAKSAWIFDMTHLDLEIPTTESVIGGGLPETDTYSGSTGSTGSTEIPY